MSGRYLFQPAADDLKVNASTAVTTTVTPEGRAATLGEEGVAGRERGFAFPGTARSFVYPEPALPSFRSGDSAGSGSLVGPDGATVPDWSFNQGWLLPSDGTYTLRVTPSLAATWAGTPVTMRVRQAVSLPTMAYDVPTRFTVEQPDRWIVARVDVPNGQYSHRFHVLRARPGPGRGRRPPAGRRRTTARPPQGRTAVVRTSTPRSPRTCPRRATAPGAAVRRPSWCCDPAPA